MWAGGGSANQREGRAFSLVGSTRVPPERAGKEPEPVSVELEPECLPLAVAHPRFAAQWDYELNPRSRDPHQTAVQKLRKTKVAWVCPVAPDHKWWATLTQRQRNPDCPCCADKQISVTNSLASVYPEIAEEFHPTLNRPDAPLPDGHDGHGMVGLHTRAWSAPPPTPTDQAEVTVFAAEQRRLLR